MIPGDRDPQLPIGPEMQIKMIAKRDRIIEQTLSNAVEKTLITAELKEVLQKNLSSIRVSLIVGGMSGIQSQIRHSIMEFSGIDDRKSYSLLLGALSGKDIKTIYKEIKSVIKHERVQSKEVETFFAALKSDLPDKLQVIEKFFSYLDYEQIV